MITLTIVDGKYLDEGGNEHQLPNINLIPQAGVVLGFDSVEEREQYIVSLPKQWDKAAYCDAVNEAHTEWYRSIYTRKPDLDYSGIGDIGLYLNHPDFGAQAQALQQLWWDSVEILYSHLETVTEQTALSTEDFIASLPQLNL